MPQTRVRPREFPLSATPHRTAARGWQARRGLSVSRRRGSTARVPRVPFPCRGPALVRQSGASSAILMRTGLSATVTPQFRRASPRPVRNCFHLFPNGQFCDRVHQSWSWIHWNAAYGNLYIYLLLADANGLVNFLLFLSSSSHYYFFPLFSIRCIVGSLF